MRKSLMLLTVGALLLASCRDDAETLPSPTTKPSESPTPMPATDTPEANPGSLAEALSSDAELAATRPLAESTLYYAYKEGKHVSVFRRNIATGGEALILEYTEPYEAEHSGNSWAEQVPSVGLDKTNGLLVYASETDVMSFGLESGVTATVLRREDGTPFGDRPQYRWLTESGDEICCAFGLASISAGPSGRATIRTVHWEGSGRASFAIDGSDLCRLETMDGSPQPLGGREWNGAGRLVDANRDEDYTTPGLFLTAHDQPCVVQEIAQDLPQLKGNSGFQDASWSADEEWIVATMWTGFDSMTTIPVFRVRSDGSTGEVLVPAGLNASPIFSPDGSLVYYAQAEDADEQGSVSDWRITAVHVESGDDAGVPIDLPPGWHGLLRGWTPEGYLVLGLSASDPYAFYGSFKGRIAIVDPIDGSVVYMSAQRDFTNYLGFVPN
jgi:hypothetical protein